MRPGTAVCSLALLGSLSLASCRRGDETNGREPASASGGEQPAQQVACGKATCGAGEVCCNPSCGICAPPDGMCTQQFCDEAPPTQAGEAPPVHNAVTACDSVRCKSGTHCELVQVQCVRAPCDPVPECKGDDSDDSDEQ